jgi:acetyl esterase
MTDTMPPLGPLDPLAAQFAAFFEMDPVWQGLMQRPAVETRAAIKAATPPGEPRPVEHVEDFSIPVAGGEIGLRLYRPVRQPHAIIIWAHGGGFVLGSIVESDAYARALALATGCAVMLVEYRLAPEHPFPTPLNDVISATLWTAQWRSALAGGEEVPLILGGDSAGANLATVATRKLHRAKACVIAANVLAYPCTENEQAPSLQRFAPPFLKAAEISWFFDQYLPDKAARDQPDFAPAYAQDLGLLPPSLIITAEHDLMTEQALSYAHKLEEQGVAVRRSFHAGMIHGFLTLEPYFAGAAGVAMHEISAFVKQTVEQP